MNQEELQQLQGANDLLQVGVERGARQLLDAQLSIADTVYGAVRRVGAPACIVNGVEGTQEAITRVVYGGVVMGSRGLHAVAATVLARYRR